MIGYNLNFINIGLILDCEIIKIKYHKKYLVRFVRCGLFLSRIFLIDMT